VATTPGVVIVGAGQAGGELAVGLRSKGWTDPITLIGREPYAPYQRPPLSKDFLLGKVTADSLSVRPSTMYDKLGVTCLLTAEVAAVDRDRKMVQMPGLGSLRYDKLVFATGGNARQYSQPGPSPSNVYYLRTIADAQRLHQDLPAIRSLVIVGGGYIGLEIAAVARTRGIATTVVEEAPRLLARTTGPEVAAFFDKEHRARGVAIRTGVRVEGLGGDGVVEEVVVSNGERLSCDAVIFGIGLVPETTLAVEAGLDVNLGILVDKYLQTHDPDILAIGDCAEAEHAFYGRHVRLESIPNATEQARVAAATICGEKVEYAAVPWFWSDQYDLKYQSVGLSTGHEHVVIRGSMAGRSFLAFYLKDDEVISVESVNRPAEFMIAKKLVKQRVRAPRQTLMDEGAPLKGLLHPVEAR
jgi:3-phenylpropionate/trans-cinnamate dioxygenase ferredoxin reductase component